MPNLLLDDQTPADPALQGQLTVIDETLRKQLGMGSEQAAAGLLDLRSGRLAMVHPDRIEYGASVPKIGILLAWFHLHPEAADRLDPEIRHALGLMVKASSNEMAARFSMEIGLGKIQSILVDYGFYNAARGGGIWVGKHYGRDEEIIKDPVGNHSHGVTIRQILRFFLLLEQGNLVSAKTSSVMREIFASPDIPHDPIKFVAALADRPVSIIRKWGSWENWLHDSAIITGPNRHYILAGVTCHPRGDDYLTGLARSTDDLLAKEPSMPVDRDF